MWNEDKNYQHETFGNKFSCNITDLPTFITVSNVNLTSLQKTEFCFWGRQEIQFNYILLFILRSKTVPFLKKKNYNKQTKIPYK